MKAQSYKSTASAPGEIEIRYDSQATLRFRFDLGGGQTAWFEGVFTYGGTPPPRCNVKAELFYDEIKDLPGNVNFGGSYEKIGGDSDEGAVYMEFQSPTAKYWLGAKIPGSRPKKISTFMGHGNTRVDAK